MTALASRADDNRAWLCVPGPAPISSYRPYLQNDARGEVANRELWRAS
jgi:hypothetical protein